MTSPALSGRNGSAPGMSALALADGTVVACRTIGPADATTTVVLHHGWTQDHTTWDDVAPLLARSLRVVRYDARGHGRSDAGRTAATLDQLADDLADVIRATAPTGRLVIAGHSLGGPVVLAFAARHPDLLERIDGLALVATSGAGIGRDILGLPSAITRPVMRVAPYVLGPATHLPLRRMTRFPAVLAPALRTGLFGPGAATAERRRRTAAQVARSHPPTVAALANALVDHDMSAELRTLGTTRVAILGGTHDVLTPVAHSHALAAALPHASLTIYKGAGHMLPYERTTEIAAEIAALAGRDAGSAAV
ncbi:alpha/beta fold hydrolase [Nocardioides jejuensis]|nr:alpha/beta hydrolase [Nocardioides jejuensis]